MKIIYLISWFSSCTVINSNSINLLADQRHGSVSCDFLCVQGIPYRFPLWQFHCFKLFCFSAFFTELHRPRMLYRTLLFSTSNNTTGRNKNWYWQPKATSKRVSICGTRHSDQSVLEVFY